MGAGRKSRRGVMLVEKQQWFARVIAQGVSNSEACRIVGINRKTGTRWRYGRTIRNTAGEAVHYPPVRRPRRRILAICRWLSARRSLICTGRVWACAATLMIVAATCPPRRSS